MAWFDRLFNRTEQPAKAVRFFQAARVDRLTASWEASVNSINQELRSDLDRLRARSRDLVKNNDHARKFQKLVISNVVGPSGFLLQSRVHDAPNKPDQFASAAIESAFYDWCRRGQCEITGRMSFVDLCRALMGGMAPDGEYLVRQIHGASARNSYGYALQLIDVARLDTNYNQTEARGRNAVIMGVEVDSYRRPVAYHIFTRHPGEGDAGGRYRERVPAEEILHDFITEHAEQVRGVPWMSAAILSMHHLAEFEKSALLAARKGADTLGFFVAPDGTTPPLANDEGADGEPISVSVPGHYDTLPDGYDFRPYDSKYPDAMLAAFSKNYLRRIASGLNVAYNGLANDLEGVNFSSIRSGVIDERDQWMTLQGWFVESFLIPVFTSWLKSSLLLGAIKLPNGSPLPATKLDKFITHAWQGRRWQWVDPKNDIETALISIRNGLSSPQQIAAQMGLDLEEVIASLAAANVMAEAAGLPAYCKPGQQDAAPPTNAPSTLSP